jgi:hypothetical protein
MRSQIRSTALVVALVVLGAGLSSAGVESGVYRGFFWRAWNPPADSLAVSISESEESNIVQSLDSHSASWSERNEYPGMADRTLVLSSRDMKLVYGGSMGDEVGVFSLTGELIGFFWSDSFVSLLQRFELGSAGLTEEELSSVGVHDPKGFLAVQYLPVRWILLAYIACHVLPASAGACEIAEGEERFTLTRDTEASPQTVEYHDCRMAVTDSTVVSLGPVDESFSFLLMSSARGFAPHVYDIRREFGLAGDGRFEDIERLVLKSPEGRQLVLGITGEDGRFAVTHLEGDATEFFGGGASEFEAAVTW